jgi:hypothetical protein
MVSKGDKYENKFGLNISYRLFQTFKLMNTIHGFFNALGRLCAFGCMEYSISRRFRILYG